MPLFVTKPRSTEAVEGDTVIILCEVVGDPKPEVIWLRDWLKVWSYHLYELMHDYWLTGTSAGEGGSWSPGPTVREEKSSTASGTGSQLAYNNAL